MAVRRRALMVWLGCLPAKRAMAESRGHRLDLSLYELSFATKFDDPQRPLMRIDGGPFSTRFEESGGLQTLPGNKEEDLDPGFAPSRGGTDKLGRADAPGGFEMRAGLPGGRGLWPAFWLVARTQQEHLEIDVMEAAGWDTADIYQSTHLKPSRGKGIHVRAGSAGFDYTKASHSYGVEWTPDDLVFYIDDWGTISTPTGLSRVMA